MQSPILSKYKLTIGSGLGARCTMACGDRNVEIYYAGGIKRQWLLLWDYFFEHIQEVIFIVAARHSGRLGEIFYSCVRSNGWVV